MDKMTLPKCVGIIMDGNRRWAKKNGKLSLEGHKAGGEKIKQVVKWAKDAGVEHIILYTFSTENWNRSEVEVSYLLNLIGSFLENEIGHFKKEGGVLHFAGDIEKFSPDLKNKLINSKEETKDNSGPHVYFALNYGGRAEIISAIKKIIKSGISADEIDEKVFEKNLQTYPMPDPDIIIRTSGEMRLSGFLPWQGVYSELFFTETLWPDFSQEEFLDILNRYGNRERRVGK